MANKRTIKLSTHQTREHAKRLIDRTPDGYVVVISEESRSQEQNRLMWPTIQEIQRQVPEMGIYSAEDIKLRFLHALGVEMRFLPELEGGGMFPVGQRSSTLTKAQFSGLIDLLHEYAARHGVVLPAQAIEAGTAKTAGLGSRERGPEDAPDHHHSSPAPASTVGVTGEDMTPTKGL